MLPQRTSFLILPSAALCGVLKPFLCPVFCVCSSLAAVELRLKNGGHRCEGRVEAKYQGQWGTLSDYNYQLEDAAVVCRQLGCGDAVDALENGHFGAGVGPIWLKSLNCKGTELTISDCHHSPFDNYHSYGFSHNWDAGVVCSGKACLVWQTEGIASGSRRNSLRLIPRITVRMQDHSL